MSTTLSAAIRTVERDGWLLMERTYCECDCGGWDETLVSRDDSVRRPGRRNHTRACLKRETR